jgi:hypothetical protein
MKKILSIIVAISFIITCQSKKDLENLAPGVHKVICQEVIQTSAYTYLGVMEEDKETWLAIPSTDAKEGNTYYYQRSSAAEMIDFKSKELNRTFPKVLFLEGVSSEPIITQTKLPHPKPTLEQKEVTFEAIKDGITISELFKNKKNYAGKTVKVKGEVTKFSQGIMNKNWIHLQDGTKDNDDYDLIITSNVGTKVGDVITIKGKVFLDKDFGHGYFYKLIIEEGTIEK